MAWFKQDDSHCSVRKTDKGQGCQQEAVAANWAETGEPGLGQCMLKMWQGLQFWVHWDIRVEGLANTWDLGCGERAVKDDLKAFSQSN